MLPGFSALSAVLISASVPYRLALDGDDDVGCPLRCGRPPGSPRRTTRGDVGDHQPRIPCGSCSCCATSGVTGSPRGLGGSWWSGGGTRAVRVALVCPGKLRLVVERLELDVVGLRTPPLRATSTFTRLPAYGSRSPAGAARPVDRLAVHGDDDVAREEARGLGRRVITGSPSRPTPRSPEARRMPRLRG